MLYELIADIGDEIGKPNSTGLKKSKESGKLICTALRLNNNNIADLSDLSTVLEGIFHDPADIEWIDLSFNDLHSVSGVSNYLPQPIDCYFVILYIESIGCIRTFV